MSKEEIKMTEKELVSYTFRDIAKETAIADTAVHENNFELLAHDVGTRDPNSTMVLKVGYEYEVTIKLVDKNPYIRTIPNSIKNIPPRDVTKLIKAILRSYFLGKFGAGVVNIPEDYIWEDFYQSPSSHRPQEFGFPYINPDNGLAEFIFLEELDIGHFNIKDIL